MQMYLYTICTLPLSSQFCAQDWRIHVCAMTLGGHKHVCAMTLDGRIHMCAMTLDGLIHMCDMTLEGLVYVP